MNRLAAILLWLVSGAALTGCGLHPLYSSESGSIARALAAVDVPPIGGRAGWLLRHALQDRLGPTGIDTAARYRLEAVLDERLEGLGLLTNETIGRERLTLRVRYQLVDISTGEVLLDATAGSDAGIDVVSGEYATIAAENTAQENLANQIADQMVTRLALFLREQP